MEIVSFEIAKKLKEKGFNVSCIYAYCKQGGWNKYTQKHEPITYILRTDGNPFGTYYIGKNWNKEYKTNKNKIQCSAPTISQVLKWLREEKKIYIMINFWPAGYNAEIYTEIGKDRNSFCWERYIDECDYCDSYELAAITGIEYVIDNLI